MLILKNIFKSGFYFTIAFLNIIFVVNCEGKKMPDSDLDKCNPFKGFFKSGEHYIEAESVKEDGTINKYFMFKNRKGRKAPCSPFKDTKRVNIRN
jgi:hypothetical protein